MGLSQDEGASFAPVVGICDFRFSHCPAGTQGHDLCVSDWEDPVGGFKADFWLKTGRCDDLQDAGTGTSDAGVPAPRRVEGTGCACTTPRTSAPGGTLVAIALGAVGFGLLRRRR